MADDMTVTVNGTYLLAERACRMVFGEDTSAGPVCASPAPLLLALDNWPRDKTADVLTLALELPIDFDISYEMGKAEAKAIVLRACRVTVLHAGRIVGHALRTDQLGINAIRTWESTWEAYKRKIRQAH